MRYRNPVVRGMYPDPSVCRAGDKYYIGCVSKEMKTIPAAQKKVMLKIEAREEHYYFFAGTREGLTEMGCADTRYLSSEVAGGFTGVVFGLYAVDENGACA